MPSDYKKKNQKEKQPQTKPNKVTAEDVPGSGLAKKAAKKLEGRKSKIERALKKAGA